MCSLTRRLADRVRQGLSFGVRGIDREPENFDAQIEEILSKLSRRSMFGDRLPSARRWICLWTLHARINEGAEISPASLTRWRPRSEAKPRYILTDDRRIQAQRVLGGRSTLEPIAELLTQHNEASPGLGVFDSTTKKLVAYLVSDELWGGAGSVADQALIRTPEARSSENNC